MQFIKTVVLSLLFILCSQKHQAILFKAPQKKEGDGAVVTRIIGHEFVKRLDPFIMLDYFDARLPAGFPDHPHRGFETITYMISGTLLHQDFKGHKGSIGPGEVQWMTAGRGIVHAEMPSSSTQSSIGFQIWLNLKAKDKMIEPNYQQFKSRQIPTIQRNGSKIKIISGKIEDIQSPIQQNTKATILHIQIAESGYFEIDVNNKWISFIYVYEGEVQYQGERIYSVPNGYACIIERSDQISQFHRFQPKTNSKFIFLSGEPLMEQYFANGPFIMNTESQLKKAYWDFRRSENGFEGAQTWRSQIRKLKENGLKEQQL